MGPRRLQSFAAGLTPAPSHFGASTHHGAASRASFLLGSNRTEKGNPATCNNPSYVVGRWKGKNTLQNLLKYLSSQHYVSKRSCSFHLEGCTGVLVVNLLSGSYMSEQTETSPSSLQQIQPSQPAHQKQMDAGFTAFEPTQRDQTKPSRSTSVHTATLSAVGHKPKPGIKPTKGRDASGNSRMGSPLSYWE